MITEQIRDEIFSSATAVQEWLYASGSAGSQLFSIAEKYDQHKDKEAYKKFAITVGDIVLGFYQIEDTVPLLQQELGIDEHTATLLGADVLDFLAPLSDPNWQPPIEDAEELDTDESTTQSSDNNAETDEPYLKTYIPPAQREPSDEDLPDDTIYEIPKLRTMADDMAHTPRSGIFEPIDDSPTPTYSSSQADIQNHSANIPDYATPIPQEEPTPPDLQEPPSWSAK